MLPQELFSSPDTKFLDPAVKTGVYLREIAKRLIKGLEAVIPDRQQRIDHILKSALRHCDNRAYKPALTQKPLLQ